MFIVNFILFIIGIISDPFIFALIAFPPLILSIVFCQYCERQGDMGGTVGQYLRKYNPFKPFSIKKILLWILCDPWFLMVSVLAIVLAIIGRKRG